MLADPTTHAAINGSVGGTSSVRTGWVNGAIDTEPITEAGQVFRRAGSTPTPDGDYVMANQVREFEPPRAMSWGHRHGGRRRQAQLRRLFWRCDLTETGDRATEVRLTYDWSEADQESREVIGFPPLGVDHLQDSLGRLADFVTSRGPRPGAPTPA